MKAHLLLLLLTLVTTAFSGRGETICDMQAARDWCDRTMLHRVEGVWRYPDDQTTVLVRRSAAGDGRYDIVVVESPDTRLQPGETIGYLEATPVGTKFEMGVYRTKTGGVLRELGRCAAELNDKEDALLVKGRKLKFSLGSRWLLPSFWRLIRITLKDPLESLPKGLVRVYPPGARRQPDYL
jgi:hypothetical protein